MDRRVVFYLMLLAAAIHSGCDSESVTGADVPATPQPSTAGSEDSLFVSPGGSNSNDCRSRQNACRTIAAAIDRVRTGETVRILPGTYSEQIRIEGRGDVSAPITIKGDGEPPILDGGRSRKHAFWLWECQGFVFENLEIRNYTNEGIALLVSSGLTVRSLVVHDNGFASTDPESDGEGFGIRIDEVSDAVIEDNEVYRNGPADKGQGILGTGIDTWGSRNVMIRHNHTYNNTGGGMLVEDSFDVTVEDNLIEGNDLDASAFEWWDGGLWVDGGGNILVRNNRFLNNLGPGIEVSDEDLRNPTGYRLEGNVSTGNYFGIYIWNFGVCPFPDSAILALSDNDFSGNSRQDIFCELWPCPNGCD